MKGTTKATPSSGTSPQAKAYIMLARLLRGDPASALQFDCFSEPLATVAREAHTAKDRVKAFRASAKTHGLAEVEKWLQHAQAADPYADPDALPQDPLNLMNGETILKTVWPEPVWAVPHLLPAGLTILAGAPKLGKSWLAMQIALAVAAGGVALGETVKQRPVCYLALEDPPRRLQERMKKQGWRSADARHADFLTIGEFEKQIHDLTNGGGEKLAKQIEQRGYGFVAIDTLSRALRGDQNDSDRMTICLTPLQEIAHKTNCAVLLVDHHRKGASMEFSDSISDILGSTAKGAMADTTWGLYRERGKTGAKLSVTGREVEEKNLALTMDWLTGVWQCDGDADALKLTERRQEIIDALGTLGKSTVIDIAKAVEQTKGNTYVRLQDMTNAGIIKREKRGKNVVYALP